METNTYLQKPTGGFIHFEQYPKTGKPPTQSLRENVGAVHGFEIQFVVGLRRFFLWFHLPRGHIGYIFEPKLFRTTLKPAGNHYV